MIKRASATPYLVCACVLAFGVLAHAGDSLWGKVTAVKSADLLTLDNGEARFDIHLAGVEVPREGPIASKAREFVSSLVLGKNARMRLEAKTSRTTFLARLQTDDPVIGFKDVGLELVRAGLARKVKGYDYKYGELGQAEKEAQRERRGLWATVQPQ